jgi:hypothetical protein
MTLAPGAPRVRTCAHFSFLAARNLLKGKGKLVALTGIEGANRQFSSVQLSPTDSSLVQLVWRSPGKTPYRSPTLSLGCHSSSFKSTGATLRSFSPLRPWNTVPNIQ